MLCTTLTRWQHSTSNKNLRLLHQQRWAIWPLVDPRTKTTCSQWPHRISYLRPSSWSNTSRTNQRVCSRCKISSTCVRADLKTSLSASIRANGKSYSSITRLYRQSKGSSLTFPPSSSTSVEEEPMPCSVSRAWAKTTRLRTIYSSACRRRRWILSVA